MCLDQYIYKYIFFDYFCVLQALNTQLAHQKSFQKSHALNNQGSFQKSQTSSVAIIMSAACSSLHNTVQLGVLLFLSPGMLILWLQLLPNNLSSFSNRLQVPISTPRQRPFDR